MTTIKLEIPSNDPSALFHMGEALRNIAKENGYIDRSETMSMEEMFEQIDEELATELQVPVSRLKGESKNVSEEDLKEWGDSFMTSVNENADETGKWIDDELLSPHVTVVEYEPAATIYPDSDKDIVIVTTTASDELIDADGLPHDKRIHSKGATRLNDDTWRMKKKPADKTDEEWAEFVDGVKAELKQLMNIPVATGEALDVLAEIPTILDELAVADLEQSGTGFEGVTPNGDVAIEPQPMVLPPIKNPFEANPLTSEHVAVDQNTKVTSSNDEFTLSVEPPVIVPPTTVTPPVVNSVTPPIIVPPATVTPPTDSDVPNTFPLFMKWLTTNNKKLTSDMVNKVLNDNGVTAIPLLTSRVDLIPQIHAELVKLL